MNPYIPVAPHGIDPSLAVGITNPGGPNPMDGNVLLCSVSSACLPSASNQTRPGCRLPSSGLETLLPRISPVTEHAILVALMSHKGVLHPWACISFEQQQCSGNSEWNGGDSGDGSADREPSLPSERGSASHSLPAIWLCPEDCLL